MNDESISIGSAVSNRITGHTTPSAVIADIRGGKWAKEIAALRTATGDVADRLKKNLPGILWTGTFGSRKNDGIEHFSGYLCADIDKVPDRLGELHDIARHDPHTVAAFVSPSGTGFKIVFQVPVPADATHHQHNFNAVRAHVATHYHAPVDEAAKDVARLCFVSHDAEAFFKTDAEPLDVCAVTIPNELPLPQKSCGKNGAEKGGRNNAAFNLACACRDQGQTPDEARAAVRDFAVNCTPPLPEAEAETCVKSAFSQPPRPPVLELPAPIDAAEFLATPIDLPPQLVEGILDKGSKFALGGASKAKKTWVLTDLAISVATGTPWLGRPTIKGKVLFLNFEIRAPHWQRRIEQVARAKGVKIEPGQITVWNLRGYAADFKVLIPEIIKYARHQGFDLIILDPIYKIYRAGADENSTGDMADLMNGLERVAVQTSAAIAYGAHFSKGNQSAKNAIDRISGSGVYGRDPDALLIFTEHDEPDAFTVEPILRDFAPVASFVVRWQFPLMRPADDLDPAKLKQVVGRKKEHEPKKLLAVIEDTTPENPISISAWAAAGNVARQTLTDYLPEMRRKNWVKTVGNGNTARQFITNEGKAYINEN